MGRDSYALPCYFCTPNRYQFYRIGSLGHNTITMNGALHDYPSRSRVVAFNSSDGAGAAGGANAWTVLDLSPHFASLGVRATRGFALFGRRGSVLVVDEVTVVGGVPPRNLTWAAHVNATVTARNATAVTITGVEGGVATLALQPDASACRDAVLSSVPVVLVPPQLPSTGFARMQIVSQDVGGCGRIVVTVGTGSDGAPLPEGFSVAPLGEWGVAGPFKAA